MNNMTTKCFMCKCKDNDLKELTELGYVRKNAINKLLTENHELKKELEAARKEMNNMKLPFFTSLRRLLKGKKHDNK